MSIEITSKRQHQDGSAIYDLHHHGRFIIGASSMEEIAARHDQLVDNHWQFLHLYGPIQSPLKWIAHVREHGWRFDNQAAVEHCRDGRVFFSGNIVEYSAAFRFLILDMKLAEDISKAAPEVPVKRPVAQIAA